MMRHVLHGWIAFWLLAGHAPASDEGWRVLLKTGNVLYGQLLRQDSVEIELKTQERGIVVIPKIEIEHLERIEGKVTASTPQVGAADAESVPEKFSIAHADAIRLELEAQVKGLVADVPLPFESSEFGKGRWKWPGPYRGFMYRDACPSGDQHRIVGDLVYHLERSADGETLHWVPLRFDVLRGQWHVRGYVPPSLAVHRALHKLRAELDAETVHLSRIAELQNDSSRARHPEKVLAALRQELTARHDRAAERYVKAAWIARRFLPRVATPTEPQVLEAGTQEPSSKKSESRAEKDEGEKGGKSETEKDPGGSLP